MNVVAFTLLLLATAALAGWRGGQPEKIVAGIFVAAYLATFASYTAAPARFARIEPFVAAIDIAVLAGVTLVLLRADRFWPIAAFAAQGVAVLTHLIKLIDPGIVRKAYAIALAAPGWLAVLILLAGVVRHARRAATFGRQRDWSW
ncbi:MULTISPECIES: hypothetical protein [unclassified Sphingomonas]|jgi:imidazolonepropionase-like amidohydrolase|uniref:hypothetical protein n=1 Tax=unclassified Sphingomonas TaxID=196159 RepID=UPI000E10DBF5|nr:MULTISPECIES: hypothetical protein [unclassified Sphingomonas]AXJ95301.1 hypothetical protein DM480_07045 [Sphingomonas sp. FARSPH]